MRKVYKYALRWPMGFDTDVPIVIDLPSRFTIVYAAPSADVSEVTLWVQHVEPAKMEPVRFTIWGTGRPIPDEDIHVLTWLDPPYVWHLYRELPAF